MEGVEVIESTMATIFKSRGFRKRGRNWFRVTPAELYQVVNLQKSSWGGGNCYLNLGWDPVVPNKGFSPENQCAVRMRAERADVIPAIPWLRPDGSATEFPGITLLTSDAYGRMPTEQLVEAVAAVIAVPVADLMDATVSMGDLKPLLMARPWLASRSLRDFLGVEGRDIPTSW